MIELLQEDAKKKQTPIESPEHQAEREEDEDHVFVCRLCSTEITTRRQLFAIRAASYVQVFPNPYGHMKVIYTFRDAKAVKLSGAPTSEFTWFQGYTWRIASCAACSNHLGWIFEAMEGSEPPSFYGLLKDELEEISRSALL